MLFAVLLLLLDFSGGIDFVSLRYPVTIFMFSVLLAVSYPFIYWGIVIGKKRSKADIWPIVGGCLGLVVYIALFSLLTICSAKVSI